MTTHRPLRFAVLFAPFHPTGQSPTLALEHDPEQAAEKAGS